MAWNDENITPSVTQETDAALVSLGQRGSVAVNGDSTEGNYAAVQCITDCDFSALTALNSDFTVILGETIPAGTIIYGAFTQVNANSGIYIAYKA